MTVCFSLFCKRSETARKKADVITALAMYISTMGLQNLRSVRSEEGVEKLEHSQYSYLREAFHRYVRHKHTITSSHPLPVCLHPSFLQVQISVPLMKAASSLPASVVIPRPSGALEASKSKGRAPTSTAIVVRCVPCFIDSKVYARLVSASIWFCAYTLLLEAFLESESTPLILDK